MCLLFHSKNDKNAFVLILVRFKSTITGLCALFVEFCFLPWAYGIGRSGSIIRRRRQSYLRYPESLCHLSQIRPIYTQLLSTVCRVAGVGSSQSGRNEDMWNNVWGGIHLHTFEYFLSLLTFLPNVVLE